MSCWRSGGGSTRWERRDSGDGGSGWIGGQRNSRCLDRHLIRMHARTETSHVILCQGSDKCTLRFYPDTVAVDVPTGDHSLRHHFVQLGNEGCVL